MKLKIDGIPLAKARHRAGRYGHYDPQDKQKKDFKICLLSEISKNYKEASDLIQGESFSIIIDFYFPLNKTESKGKKEGKLLNLVPHTKKPDIDNLCKFFFDCANGILFKDDKMIVSLFARKQFSDNPRTEVLITNLTTPLPEGIS